MSDASRQTYTRLYSGWSGGYAEPAERVLRSPGELAAVWRTIHDGAEGEPLPAVDFGRQMVVLLALGRRPTSGYSLRFDGVASATATGPAVVRYTVTSPGPGCMMAQVLSSPAELVAVARVDGPVQFERRDVVSEC